MQSIMSTLPSCMDRYINRYMIPQSTGHQSNFYHQTQQQQHQQHQYHQAQHGGPTGPPVQHGNGNSGNYNLMGCYQNANGWTGVPLISTAARRPRKHNNHRHVITNPSDFDENAMSRLAIHAHGAPLILSGRYKSRHSQQQQQQKRDQSKTSAGNNREDTNSDRISYSLGKHQPHAINNNNNSNVSNNNNIKSNSTDTFSINSDESSCSSNGNSTETCLPRIIKPRKRRKKDRKPNVLVQEINVQNNNSNSQLSSDHNAVDHSINNHTLNNGVYPISEEPISPQSNYSEASTNLNTTSEDLIASSCSCRLCDPSCRIWAFPLRRSCSDNTDVETRQVKDVGVIGSNRMSTVKNEWRSSPQLIGDSQILPDRFEYNNVIRKESFSDSCDSGCEILGGLHFSDNILTGGNADDQDDGSSPINQQLVKNTNNSFGDNFDYKFSPSDSVFSTSISEITRKMMESIDLRSVSSSDSGSTFSDSVFSDEYLLNLQALAQSDLFCSSSQIDQSSNYCFDQTNMNGLLKESFMFNEKDRGDEVINCFDMIWSSTRLLPVEE